MTCNQIPGSPVFKCTTLKNWESRLLRYSGLPLGRSIFSHRKRHFSENGMHGYAILKKEAIEEGGCLVHFLQMSRRHHLIKLHLLIITNQRSY